MKLAPGMLCVRAAALAAAAVLVWLAFRNVDPNRVWNLIQSSAGPALALVVLPQALSLISETSGWVVLCEQLGYRARFSALLGVRVGTEALSLSLPGGAAWGESAKLFLLKSRCGFSAHQSLAAMAARSFTLLTSQSIFLAFVFVIAAWPLHATLQANSASSLWMFAPLLAALGLGTLGLSARHALKQSSLARRASTALALFPSKRWRTWLRTMRRSLGQTDAEVARVFRQPWHQLARALPWFFVGWVFESLETYLLLALLGCHLPLPIVLTIEALAVLVRHVLFIFPAGVGAQDLGYVFLLSLFGAPDPASVGAAFLVLKRSKELLLASIGYGILISGGLFSRTKKPIGSEQMAPAPSP